MSKKVLIVSYTFPPKSGIGGRRWAKFAKYLNRSGTDVRVLTFTSKGDSNLSNWKRDINEYEDKIEKVHPIKPYFIDTNSPNSIIGKVRYRFSLFFWKLKYRGNYFDETVAMQKQVMNLLEKYYSQGFNNIVITSAPFLLSYYGALFKVKYPLCNLLLDFRDPWTNNQMGYQYRFLPKDRLEFEKQIEKITINNSNFVYSVNQTMVNYFNSINLNKSVISKLINNGYDVEDFIFQNTTTKKVDSDKINFIYAGAIYEETEYILDPFFDAINQLDLVPGIEDKILFNFYCDIQEKYKSKINNSKIIKINKPVSLTEIHQLIEINDICMLFLTKDMRDSFSTKFYEYLFHKKFILVFSEKGETANFVETNRIGLHIGSQNIFEKISEIILKPDLIRFNKEFNSSMFDVRNIADNINNDLI